jgi:hypothetical protein
MQGDQHQKELTGFHRKPAGNQISNQGFTMIYSRIVAQERQHSNSERLSHMMTDTQQEESAGSTTHSADFVGEEDSESVLAEIQDYYQALEEDLVLVEGTSEPIELFFFTNLKDSNRTGKWTPFERPVVGR